MNKKLIKNKPWIGTIPEKCQLCGEPIEKQFVDGRDILTGHWAIMCINCFINRGSGLGVGRGQLYELEDDTYYKVFGDIAPEPGLE